MLAKNLKQLRIKRRHVTHTLLWLGAGLMAFDALFALGFLHIAQHFAHISGASGATISGVAAAIEDAANAVD